MLTLTDLSKTGAANTTTATDTKPPAPAQRSGPASTAGGAKAAGRAAPAAKPGTPITVPKPTHLTTNPFKGEPTGSTEPKPERVKTETDRYDPSKYDAKSKQPASAAAGQGKGPGKGKGKGKGNQLQSARDAWKKYIAPGSGV